MPMLTFRQMLVLTAAALILSSATQRAHSQPAATPTRGSVIFVPPPQRRRPASTIGAGSRQDWSCFSQPSQGFAPEFQPPLPLVPTDSNYGQTQAAHPTFWIYLPRSQARQAILSIRDEAGQYHSQTTFPLTGAPGTVGLSLPLSAPPLEIDRDYEWAVVLVCNQQPLPNDPAVTAWVRRVAMPPAPALTTPLERAVWYGNNSLWYDTLDQLARGLRSQPNNPALAAAWENVLREGKLETLAERPLEPFF
ncbi:MAG: DUF928 domain-containing protein [Chloroflexaceae bacterium]|nr:DUF928 domain-containing protein [Chloroflexaceae bacterium]